MATPKIKLIPHRFFSLLAVTEFELYVKDSNTALWFIIRAATKCQGA